VNDKTEILVTKGLMGDDLTPEEARQVAERLESNTEAMQRFLLIEDQLDDIVKMVDKIKSGGKWLGAFLVANYGLEFRHSIESVIISVFK